MDHIQQSNELTNISQLTLRVKMIQFLSTTSNLHTYIANVQHTLNIPITFLLNHPQHPSLPHLYTLTCWLLTLTQLVLAVMFIFLHTCLVMCKALGRSDVVNIITYLSIFTVVVIITWPNLYHSISIHFNAFASSTSSSTTRSYRKWSQVRSQQTMVQMYTWDCWTESPGQDRGCWHHNHS